MRYADHKFTQAEQEIGETGSTSSTDLILEYQARGVFYLPEKARFQHLLDLPEGEDIARAINDAMRAIEEANSGLDSVLPKTYNRLERSILIELPRTDNANYLWIQLFLSALNPSGRAGFVMTNDELCR